MPVYFAFLSSVRERRSIVFFMSVRSSKKSFFDFALPGVCRQSFRVVSRFLSPDKINEPAACVPLGSFFINNVNDPSTANHPQGCGFLCKQFYSPAPLRMFRFDSLFYDAPVKRPVMCITHATNHWDTSPPSPSLAHGSESCPPARVLLALLKQGQVTRRELAHLHGRRFFPRFPTSFHYYKFSFKLNAMREPGFFTAPLRMFLSVFHTPESRRLRLPIFSAFRYESQHNKISIVVSPGFLFRPRKCRPLYFHKIIKSFIGAQAELYNSKDAKGEVENILRSAPMRDLLLLPVGPGTFINVRRGTGGAVWLHSKLSLYLRGLSYTNPLCLCALVAKITRRKSCI